MCDLRHRVWKRYLLPTTVHPISGFQRTVVVVTFYGQLGDYLFLRGGISREQRPGMTKQN